MRILRALLAPPRTSTFPPPPWTLEQMDGPVPVFPPGVFEAHCAAMRQAIEAKP